jgi:putative hydrolase of the HAD superfamily
MQIQAVLFDLDNTLTHRDQSVQAYSRHLVKHYQHNIQANALDTLIAIVRRIDNGGYPQAEQLTHPSIAASVAYALQQELTWQQLPELDELTEFWFSHFGDFAVAMQGAERLLQQLKQAGFKLGIISNGGHKTRLNILQGLGFLDYFDVVHSSELVGIRKPQSEIFIHTAAELAVLPEQCLFVGDHPINDIQGAQSAGMKAILIEGFHDIPEDLNVAKITQLHEVWQHL